MHFETETNFKLYNMETGTESIQTSPVVLSKQDEERNHTWGENHKAIITFVESYMQKERAMPTVTAIAQNTGLGRTTVYKHLQSLTGHPAVKEHNNMFKLLATEVLRKVCSEALYGNLKAAKLYMEIMGVLKTSQTVTNNFITDTQNYVQINGIVFNDELVDGLSLEQLTEIEKIVMKGKE